MYYPREHEAPTLVNSGVLYNLNNIPNIDWTKPWWDEQSRDELSIEGHLFMSESDITLLDKAATACYYFNKQVAEDYNITGLYQMVYDNTWTLDNMVSIARTVVTDLNGDSVLDGNDRWGIYAYDDWQYIMLHGSGGRYADKDDEDIPYVSFGTESTIEKAMKITSVMYDSTVFLHTLETPSDMGLTDMLERQPFLFRTARSRIRTSAL